MYKKLVDLYAGHELPAEMEDAMEMAAFNDPELAHDMSTLRSTVTALRSLPGAEMTEESNQRILMKIYARGGIIEPKSPAPIQYQYTLPIQS